jgi:hypothetical protein
LYASEAAQSAADWIFPAAAHPFGDVTRRLGCDRQLDGSYDCVYRLAVWSSGRWTGRRAPRSVEQWACAGPMTVTVRRRHDGSISRSSNNNPCRPPGASNQSEAAMHFVATVHHRRPALGRLRTLRCSAPMTLADAPFTCQAVTARGRRMTGDVFLNGAVLLPGDTIADPAIEPPPEPAPTAPPG